MSAIILRRRKLGRATRHVAEAMKSSCKVVRNWRPKDWQNTGGVMDALTVFRWGCTSSLTGLVASENTTVVNSADSIHWCSNKRQGRLDMQAAGVPVPATYDPRVILASFGDGHEGDFQEAAQAAGIDKQWVLRPSRHSQGKNLLYGTMAELDENLNALYVGARRLYDEFLDGYMSELIDKKAEYRVLVCQNRVVWVAKKTPGNPEDVAWNVAQGGRFDNVRWSDWPLAVIRAALAAAKVGKLDFAGVDVMVDDGGKPYVLEANSAPSQTSPYRQQCLAKAFDYIAQNGKKHFEDVTIESWKDCIHPAVRNKDDT